MTRHPGIITTDVPALPASGLPEGLRTFVGKPWAYRRRFLQSCYRTAFDGYSFAGQTDSLNQGPQDALHSFVLSDFSPRSAFPEEFQCFLRDEWPAVTRVAREIERDLLVQLDVEDLLGPYEKRYGHMMSANYYPPSEAPANGGLRLTEHPDVSLLTVFPFGLEAGFEYQDAGGVWCALAPTNRMVCFVGELLEWVTAGRIQALNHRVALVGGEPIGERFSFSLFSLPYPGTRIERHFSAAQEGFGARPESMSVEAYIEAHLSRWL